MKIHLTALLDSQAEHYALPRGRERFQAYLERALGHDEALSACLASAPAEAREVLASLDAHRALGSEAIAERALAELTLRLEPVVDADLRVALCVVDDALGRWSDRRLALMHPQADGLLAQGVVLVPLGSALPASEALVRRAVDLALYRALHVRAHGVPRVLAQRLLLEGRARRFAGDREPRLDPEELWFVRCVLQPYLDTDDPALAFACLFGDAAARAVGYPALGLSPDAGLALALADESLEVRPPEQALVTQRDVARLATG